MLAARWSYVSDRATLDVAAGMLAELEPDIALIHLGGLDAVSHRFVAPGMPEYFTGLSPDAAERYADVLPAYHEFIDSAVRRIQQLGDDRTVFLLCSTYGTHPAEGDIEDRWVSRTWLTRRVRVERTEDRAGPDIRSNSPPSTWRRPCLLCSDTRSHRILTAVL